VNRSCLILLACWFCAANPAFAATNDFFASGVNEYHNGNFPAATRAFENSVKQQPSVGALVDLGITEWRRGHAGAAILAWEKAQWIAPFDSRVRMNLGFARQITQVSEPELKWFEVPSTWLPPNAWVWLAGISLWLAVGAATLPALFRRKKAGWQQTLAALGTGMFLFCMTANIGVISRTQIGFVLKKDAPLLLTPTHDAEMVATLSDGEPVRRLRQSGEYWLVRTMVGTGWIERKQVGLVSPD
jgi:hypothetical protein